MPARLAMCGVGTAPMAEQRIVLDGRSIADHFPGIGRYVYNLARGVGELAPPHRLFVLHNPDQANTRYDMSVLAQHANVELIDTSARPFSPAEQWRIPALLRQLRADLYHAPYYVRPYVGLPCPSVTTLYDAIPQLFPTEVSFRARLLFGTLTRLAARSSSRILTISASAGGDLARLYGFDPAKITVTPLAADERFRPQSAETIQQLRSKYSLPKRYMLSLASNKPHKNLPLLIESFALLQRSNAPTLVLAGHWDARFPGARAEAERSGLQAQIRFLPNVANEDLPALYAGAELFVFPSRYEGFGLPPLEALAVGTPVICGDHSSLPEVVGDAALFVDVADAAAIANGMQALLNNAAKRAELRARGFEQAARFSWQRTAQQTLQIYEDCLRSRSF